MVETEEKKLTSSEIDKMLEEAAAYHAPKKKKSKDSKKKRKPIRIDIIIAAIVAIVVLVGVIFTVSKIVGKTSSNGNKSKVENPLEDDKYDEITDVVNNYLNAYLVEDAQQRLDIMARYVDNIGDLSESDVAQKKYIDSYSSVECYTKNGLYENTYVVYAYYQTEYKNISTKVPNLTTYYIIRDANTGNVYIHNEWSNEIKEYIEEVSKDSDVKQLIADVQKELEEAKDSDESLKSFLDALTKKAEETTTPAQTTVQSTSQNSVTTSQATQPASTQSTTVAPTTAK